MFRRCNAAAAGSKPGKMQRTEKQTAQCNFMNSKASRPGRVMPGERTAKHDWNNQDQLTNNRQNIRRIEERLKALQTVKASGNQEQDYGVFRSVENTEIMRLQLFFDEKPAPEVREIVKRHGFRWAPSSGCWQRTLTPNARYSLQKLLEAMKEDL